MFVVLLHVVRDLWRSHDIVPDVTVRVGEYSKSTAKR